MPITNLNHEKNWTILFAVYENDFFDEAEPNLDSTVGEDILDRHSPISYDEPINNEKIPANRTSWMDRALW